MVGGLPGAQRAQADPGRPHKARLSFPSRRTADGLRISDMGAADAAAALAEITGASGDSSPEPQGK